MTEARACINAIGTAVPDHEAHRAFIAWAEGRIGDERKRLLFRRMAERSGIERRWSVLAPAGMGASAIDHGGFYAQSMPPTSLRMERYAKFAPDLAMQAIGRLEQQVSLHGISHIVVASCTGFVAPGIDQIIAERLGLRNAERTLVGFMGCYAAVIALRTARHIVRSEPSARVLVVTVELTTLHLQEVAEVESLLMMLQFGDGAAAALVTSGGEGLAIERQFSHNLDESSDLIRWTIGDTGFEMHLSGQVPGRIQTALRDEAVRRSILGPDVPAAIGNWAVHAGGRSILDAVQNGFDLGDEALAVSRSVLARFGNMSSSTLMFTLADMLARDCAGSGVALAFGPGLAAEGFRFERAG